MVMSLLGVSLLADDLVGVLVHDDTDGVGSIVQRDEPSPAGLVSESFDPDGVLPLGALGVLVNTIPVAPNSDVAESLVVVARFVVASGHDAIAAGRVDEPFDLYSVKLRAADASRRGSELRTGLAFDVVGTRPPRYGDGPLATLGEVDLGDFSVFVDLAAKLAGVVHEELIEFGADLGI